MHIWNRKQYLQLTKTNQDLKESPHLNPSVASH